MKKSIKIFVLSLSLLVIFAYSSNASARTVIKSKDLTANIIGSSYDSKEDFSYTFTRDLYKGMKGDPDVKALKTILRLEKLYGGIISGNFTKKTAKAVGRFQDKYEIGRESKRIGRLTYPYVGPNTREVLNELYSDEDKEDEIIPPTSCPMDFVFNPLTRQCDEKKGASSKPEISLWADKTQVTSGESVNVYWSVINADKCNTYSWDQEKGWIPVSVNNNKGSKLFGPLYANRLSSFTITCKNKNTTESKTVEIKVGEELNKPVIEFFNSQAGYKYILKSGEQTQLFWHTTGADSCTISGSGGSNINVTTSSRSGIGNPLSTGPLYTTTQYTLTCRNVAGEIVKSAFTIVVLDAPNTNFSTNNKDNIEREVVNKVNTLLGQKALFGKYLNRFGISNNIYLNSSSGNIKYLVNTNKQVLVVSLYFSDPNFTGSYTYDAITQSVAVNIAKWSLRNFTDNLGINAGSPEGNYGALLFKVYLNNNLVFNNDDRGDTTDTPTSQKPVIKFFNSLEGTEYILRSGEQTKLYWHTTGADSCAISSSGGSNINVTTSSTVNNYGSKSPFITGPLYTTTQYTLTCRNVAGETAQSTFTVVVLENQSSDQILYIGKEEEIKNNITKQIQSILNNHRALFNKYFTLFGIDKDIQLRGVGTEKIDAFDAGTRLGVYLYFSSNNGSSVNISNLHKNLLEMSIHRFIQKNITHFDVSQKTEYGSIYLKIYINENLIFETIANVAAG